MLCFNGNMKKNTLQVSPYVTLKGDLLIDPTVDLSIKIRNHRKIDSSRLVPKKDYLFLHHNLLYYNTMPRHDSDYLIECTFTPKGTIPFS